MYYTNHNNRIIRKTFCEYQPKGEMGDARARTHTHTHTHTQREC